MKIFNQITVAIIFVCLIGFTSNCKKDSPSPTPLTPEERINLNINQFIWSGLNYWYLWVDSVPNLSPINFQDTNKLNAFLMPYTDHEKLFEDLLYKRNTVDKWSWIVENYSELENELQGITKTMGFDFGLVRYGSAGTNVLGYVRYVYPNSPASQAGLMRGDIFTKIDDQQITTSNYSTLLFDKETFKLSFADVSGNSIVPNNRTVNITAIEMQENPIFLDTVYTINSNKIGYLVYNGFYANFDVDLNNVFTKFKAANIQNLILDLRYNGGGSIQSAIYLSSMIYSTDHSKVFSKLKYNKQVQADIIKYYGTSILTDYFTDTIARKTGGAPTTIASLGLNKLYVITSGSTASASELVINGLKPYINVITIGTNSVGKYVGSITVKDEDSKGNVNPNDKWAMQPIVLKISNANDVSDYVNGFTPKVVVNEVNYLGSLKPLGDVNDPLLKAALNDLQGLPQQSAVLKSTAAFQKIADSKDLRPHGKEMYTDMKLLKHRRALKP